MPVAAPRLRRTLAGLLAALAACGPSQGPEVRLERAEFLLVDRPESMRVLEENRAGPVDFGMVLPSPSSTHDAGPLPSVRMTPPATVEFRLPELPQDAELAFALGVDESGYEARGRQTVHFRVALDGREVHGSSLLASRRMPRHLRLWERVRVPLEGARTLRLSTEFEGTVDVPPRVGFGLLEVRVPFVTRRQVASSERPNVVLAMIDTLRADRLGAYGSEGGLTPAMDALAERGTVFERCFAPSPWTWPSTASLFTGLAPPAHGVESEMACFLSHDLVTLAEAFRDAGLRTAAFSTNKLIGTSKNFDQGFEDFLLEPWAPAREIHGEVESWLRERSDWRFFLYLHLTDPHTPYDPEPDLRERFAGEAPEGWEPGETWREIRKKLQGEEYDPERIEAFVAHDRRLYDGEVAGVDRALGRLLALLGELGLAENTIVCVTSDHGEEFHEHGMYHHTKQLYDEVLHVPLVLAGPRVEAGRRIAEPVSLSDLGATLLGRADLDRRGLAGRDLLGDAPPRGPLYFATAVGWWYDEERGELVRKESELFGRTEGDEHFVWAPPPRADGTNGGVDDVHRVRLFERSTDPAQTRDLSDERPDAVARHRAELEAWLEESLRRRPNTFGGDADVLDLLEELGYVVGDGDDAGERE